MTWTSRENTLSSFANGTCGLVENEADALEDRLEFLGPQLQIVHLFFENLVGISQTKAHPYPRSIHTPRDGFIEDVGR